MIFGETPLAEAKGAILAHSINVEGIAFKKGRRLSETDVSALTAAGLTHVIAARLEPDDVHEDDAAASLAEALRGDGLTSSVAFTGRCNLMADTRGLLVLDRDRLDRLNLVDEAVTVASLPPFAAVEARQMVATIKIIPFAVERNVHDRVLDLARGEGPLMRVASFVPRRVGLVQTCLPGMKESLLDKTFAVVNARLAALDCAPATDLLCKHRPEAVAQSIESLLAEGSEILLVSGASAIVDRRDVVPAGIEAAGGTVDHFGMPVDPGNLLLLARLGTVPVIGLPGCARSPKLNGFDWVLQRLVAGLEVLPADVMRMGAGGLLKETGVRPLPRAQAVEGATAEEPMTTRSPHVATIVLAAGRSTRMGGVNKLLADVAGQPMVVRVVTQVLASQARPVVVVTGHERERVTRALEKGGVTDSLDLVHNPDFEAGLSGSLHRGLAALPADSEAALVCLADMPGVTAEIIDRLIAAFDTLEGRAICVPTWGGKRGNPVLLAHRFFAEVQSISGDVGAKALIGEYPEAVCEVAMDDLASGSGVLSDVDTPEALRTLALDIPPHA